MRRALRRIGHGADWPPFADRHDAGRRLAEALRERSFDQPVVLGIPRGGVVVSLEIAQALGAEHGVIVARKLGAPGEPELAVGAVTAGGVAYINEETARAAGASAAYLEAERARQTQEAHRREERFDGHRRPKVAGRVVIVVDDGVATGATAIAAIRAMKAEGAGHVVFAVPVGPPDTLARLAREADEVVCLHEEARFFAVGLFYQDFRPVEDEDVIRMLAEPPPPAPAANEPPPERPG